MRTVRDLPDSDYLGKKAFVRADLNVPISEGMVTDDYRIRMSLPTIRYLLERGARVVLTSHLGRPNGREPSLSLYPVVDRLRKLLPGVSVGFSEDCVGEATQAAIRRMKNGELLLLENLRFHKGEKENDDRFSEMLSREMNLFVQDAFGVAHRTHASTVGLTRYITHRVAGLLLEKEVAILSRVRDDPARPFILVVGGIKISDKLEAISGLMEKADEVLLGGGVAYTFLSAKGIPTGRSPVEADMVEWARSSLNSLGGRIHLPSDSLASTEMGNTSDIRLAIGEIPDPYSGFDIGPSTAQLYHRKLAACRGTVFWNGPMGVFELERYSGGTLAVALGMVRATRAGATTVVGGGESSAALERLGIDPADLSHVSTGGGASLEFLSGRPLPGLQALD